VLSRRLMGGFRLGNRRWYPLLFVVLCFALFGVAIDLGGRELKIEWVVSILGGVGGLTTFLYTQHLQETRLFTELFKDFNGRYNALNHRINAIAEKAGTRIQAEDRQVLMDYFNLCAEEFLFFGAGYIDETVWRSWVRGMKSFADVPGIRSIWLQELESDSYYGFSLQEIEMACR
jgi:hypothetical protein